MRDGSLDAVERGQGRGRNGLAHDSLNSARESGKNPSTILTIPGIAFHRKLTTQRKNASIDVGIKLRMAGRVKLEKTMRSAVGAICESRVNYWAAYATDFSCPCIFAYLGTQHASSWPAIVLSSLAGLFFFSLIEYAIHRWLLHDRRSALFYLHAAHHLEPGKTSAFLFPTSFLLFISAWYLLTWGLHFHEASYFMMGLSGGYFYFDTLHHIEHTTRINQIPFRWLKKTWAFHSVHHRIDQGNFGVTTSFWDVVFGTHQKQVKRRQTRASGR